MDFKTIIYDVRDKIAKITIKPRRADERIQRDDGQGDVHGDRFARQADEVAC